MLFAEIRDSIYLYGFTEKQAEYIKDSLTFKNPQYEKVMRYSKYATTRVPRYIQYFKEKYFPSKNRTALIVPIGTDLSKFKSEISGYNDNRVFPEVEFPKFTLTLRDTQRQAFEAYMGSVTDTHFGFPDYKSCVQLPTGKGKTVLGLKIASELNTRTLVIVHKDDLVKGWLKDIETAFDSQADIGIIKAQKRHVGKHITIATVQTLNRLKTSELERLYSAFGLIIQDEMHHCPSTSFSIGNRFRAKYRLGLTATPERNDGLTHIMRLYYGGFCYKYEYDESDTDILPVEVKRCIVGQYFNPVIKRTRGKYVLGDICQSKNFDELADLGDNEYRASNVSWESRPQISHQSIDGAVLHHLSVMNQVCQDIVKEYLEGHSCIAFFRRTDSVDLYAQTLQSLGVLPDDIGLYYGLNNDCESVLKKAESKRKFITLATYGKATEGTNVKQWEVAFLVSSLNNGKDVEQAVGRIRRTFPEGHKLSHALVYDYRYANCFQLANHGETRDMRYKKMNLSGQSPSTKTGLFSRGFRKST